MLNKHPPPITLSDLSPSSQSSVHSVHSPSPSASPTSSISSTVESQIEYNYDYHICTNSKGEMYIDITIDINDLNDLDLIKPQLTFYNFPSSSSPPSPSPSPSPSPIPTPTPILSPTPTPTPTTTPILTAKKTEGKRKRRASVLEIHERSIQKHESTLLEILKCLHTNRESVISAIRYARCDVLCYFLPLITFTLCQSDKLEWRLKLLQTLSDRIIGQSDLKQSVKFLLSSYHDVTEVKAAFAGLNDSDNDNDNDYHHDNNNNNNNKSSSILSLFNINHHHHNNKEIGKSVIAFWNSIFSMKLSEGQEIVIPTNRVIRDPINPLRAPIRKLKIRKIFQSNSKPLLIDCFVGKTLIRSSTFILKFEEKGDLRKDKACLLVFKWMNHLWTNKCHLKYKCKDNEHNVRILTYRVVPIMKNIGCIELIQHCVPLRNILKLQHKLTSSDELMNNLIVTAAGSYIGGYMMGLRDRHYDNILIRSDDCSLFHIDMNYVLGDTLKGIDANQFGITKHLYDILRENDNYQQFINLSCKAFQCLRRYNEEFIAFSCLAFSYIYDYKTIRKHILRQLRMFESDSKAMEWLKNTLMRAPFDFQTQIKNKIHKFATR